MKKYIHQVIDRGDNIRVNVYKYEAKEVITLNNLIKKYNINDYYILKASDKFRLISVNDFLEMNYCIYLLLKKDIYCINYINKWLDFINYNKFNVNFLNKPFPPVEILNQIKIIN
jgi:hypothetical protein